MEWRTKTNFKNVKVQFFVEDWSIQSQKYVVADVQSEPNVSRIDR